MVSLYSDHSVVDDVAIVVDQRDVAGRDAHETLFELRNRVEHPALGDRGTLLALQRVPQQQQADEDIVSISTRLRAMRS